MDNLGHLLILLIAVCACIGLAFYAISKFNLQPPWPAIITAVCCIIGILVIVNLVGGGGNGLHISLK